MTREYFKGFQESRDKIRTRLETLQNYERVGCVMKRGSNAFVFRNAGLQNQDVLFKLPPGTEEGGAAPADVFERSSAFIDLNARDPAGTTAMGAASFSEDGEYFAFGLCKGGSDWQTVHVKRTDTGEELADALPWVKFSSISWMHDGSGFFYSRYPAPAKVGHDKAGTETAAAEHAMVMFHKLGTPAESDLLVYANPAHPVWLYGTKVSEDGEWLILTTSKGTDPVNRVYVSHLPSVWPTWSKAAAPVAVPEGGQPPAQGGGYAYLPFHRLVDNFEGEYDYVTNDGARFYWRTNLHAPKYRVVALDVPRFDAAAAAAQATPAGATDAPTPPLWDVVPEDKRDVLDWASAVGGRHMILCFLRDVANVLQLRPLPAADALPALTPGAADAALIREAVDVPLPAPGTVTGFSGKRKLSTAFIKFVSFLAPGTLLKLELGAGAAAGGSTGAGRFLADIALGGDASGPAAGSGSGAHHSSGARISTFYETQVPGFDPSRFEAVQHFVPSTDGTVKIPLFVVRKKPAPGVTPAPAPALLYGYGGFNVSLQPSFNAMRLLWLGECGGVYALACIRGGGEYGEDWHQAGMRHKKQNCFDDAAACAQYLMDTGLSAPRRVGIMGGSNGGTLVLASTLQRPDLYGCGVAQVPVADMLRFHKFTAGAFWRGEYGFAEDDAADFANLLRYSPLHNVAAPSSADKCLPSLLITTADHDDRVVPLHSLKMIATLQAVAGASPHQRRPLLARIEEKAGHGAGKPTGKVLDEMADIYAFLQHELAEGR